MSMTTREVEAALKERGIRMNVGSCGCCDSPWVKVEIDGTVVYDEDGRSLRMIEESK